jgi:hypothetical protein
LQRESKTVQFRSRCYSLTELDPLGGPIIEVPQFGEMTAEFGEMAHQYMAAVASKRQRAGSIRSRAVDPYKVQIWDRRYTPEDSPWLSYEDFELNHILYKLYPHLERLPKRKDLDPLSGLYFLRLLETAIGNTGEMDAMSSPYGGSGYLGDPTLMMDNLTSIHRRDWLEPYLYDDYVTNDQENLYDSGFIIPKGVRLGEVFPDGVCVSKINGEGVAARAAVKNDQWGGYLFMVSACGHYGVGSENLTAQQEWFNEVGSLIVTSAMYGSNGITVADSNKVRDGQVINKPGTVVGISDLFPGEKLEDVIRHITTSGLDPTLMTMPEFLKESMQLTSGARSSQVSGLPGQGISTATGVMNMAATADSAAAMKLELRAANLARRMEQALKLFQKHQTYPRYYGRFNETKGRWLRNLDIPYELRVRYEPDSHMPRTTQDKQQSLGALINLGVGQGKIDPTIETEAVRLFAPDMNIGQMSNWETLGQLRLDAMEQAAQEATQLMQARRVPDQKAMGFVLQEVLAAAAPQPLDNNDLLAKFYRDFYLSDAYRNSPPVIQMAINQLVQLHEAGSMMKAREEAAKQVAATEPLRQAEGDAQQAAGAQQMAADQQAALAEAAGREQEAEEADKQREHEREMQDGERQMQKDEQAHDLKMAKAKPKPETSK